MSKAVRNIYNLKEEIDSPLTIIIPSAGEGVRMKSYGAPKSLIKIKNSTTILEYQIKLIRKQFKNPTIILISGHESNKIIEYSPPQIIHIENEQYEQTNVVKSINMGLKATITDKVLIIYGDLIFNPQTLKLNLKDKSFLVIDTSNTMTENEVGCIIHNNKIQNVTYDLPNKWAQIVYLVGKELNIFKMLSNNPDNHRLLGFEIINSIIDKGGEFLVCKPKGIKVNDIDCTKDLIIAKKQIL